MVSRKDRRTADRFLDDAGHEYPQRRSLGRVPAFDKDADGFNVFGEAAALLIIEREDHAKARGAHPRPFAWAGITSDGFIRRPRPQRSGQRTRDGTGLQTAGLTKSDISHVNAHATSTPIGDTAEAVGSTRPSAHAAIYAPKSAFGHLIGAVGRLNRR